MVQTPQKNLTLDEFLKLPETKPASEYIDGQIIQKPMSKGKHSAIQGEFSPAINAILRTQKIARTFSELRCTFAGRSIVPDMVVFLWDRIQRDDNGEIANDFYLAPDWTIEILSPEQRQTKAIKKILLCLQHGTQMGWLIDPDEQTVFVYYPNQQAEVFDESEQILSVPTFASEIKLTVKEIFSWLLD